MFGLVSFLLCTLFLSNAIPNLPIKNKNNNKNCTESLVMFCFDKNRLCYCIFQHLLGLFGFSSISELLTMGRTHVFDHKLSCRPLLV